LYLPIFELDIQPNLRLHFPSALVLLQWYDLGQALEEPPIRIHENTWEIRILSLSSMDSGLEAFSLNPAHGSFSALTFQLTELTNYVNQRFLSY